MTAARTRWALLAVIVATALFYTPAIGAGYMADDHFHVFALRDLPELFRAQWNLFGLVTSGREVEVFRKWGVLPWWTSDAMRIDFFRPIPSLTHALDVAAFGPNPVAAHAVSIGWYALSIALVARVLARFLRGPVLVLAVAIFAFDDTHALAVQWLANRNDLVASVFLLAGFLGWLRFVEGKGRKNLVLVYCGFVLALLSKESSIVFPALVLAHALVFRVRKNALVHASLFAIGLLWMALYLHAGFGPNSVYYVNPLHDPRLFAAQFFRSGFFHAVILATGVPLHVLSSAPTRDLPLLFGLCAALTVGFWAVAVRLLRGDRAARFFVAWMVIAQLILTTSFPDPRLLYLPSIGFAYVVARVLEEAWKRRENWLPAKPVMAGLVLLHLVFAPMLDQACLFVVNRFQFGYLQLEEGLRAAVDYEHLPPEGTEVFFLNWHQREASALANLWLVRNLPSGADPTPILRDDTAKPIDRIDRSFAALRVHYYALSFLVSDVDVRVVDERTIEVAPKQGDYFPSLFEQIYLTSTRFAPGQRFELPSMTATIADVDSEHRPTRVRFAFREPLASPRYRFLAWDGRRFVTVPLSDAIGGRVALTTRTWP